ncbi:MAG: glycosyltransferase family 87 protein [Dehalococcoidia bacterium]
MGFAYLWRDSATHHERYGGDFVVFWSAANIASRGHPEDVFDLETIHAEERKTVPDSGAYPWYYPPPFLLIVRPFAALPYWLALLAWSAIGLGALGSAAYFCGGRTVGAIGLPLMAIVTNLGFGQNGWLTGAILGFGLTLVSSRPFTAGLVLGLLSYKPHFAPLAVLALLVMRNWRALAGVATSGVAFAATSAVVFGVGVWQEFLANGSQAAEALYSPGAWEKMPGVVSALMLAGAPKIVAQGGQAAWTLGLAAAVVWLVRSEASPRVRNAGIVVASLAASPYIFVYDLAALAVVYAWLLSDAKDRPFRPWELAILGVSCVSPIGVWVVADVTGIQFGPLVLLVLMAIVVGRALSSRTVSLPSKASGPTKLLEPRINPVS